MKRIPLTLGMSAKVSDRDFTYLNQFSWYAHHGHSNNLWYARTDYWVGNKHKHIFMHQLLAKRLGKVRVDHRDGDGLNNTRRNLRAITGATNSYNRKIGTNNKTGYKGVYWRDSRKCYIARLVKTINGKRHVFCLGSSSSPKQCAIWYNKAAKKHFGKFARLNNAN